MLNRVDGFESNLTTIEKQHQKLLKLESGLAILIRFGCKYGIAGRCNRVSWGNGAFQSRSFALYWTANPRTRPCYECSGYIEV